MLYLVHKAPNGAFFVKKNKLIENYFISMS